MSKKIIDALKEWQEKQIKHNEFITNPGDLVETDPTKAKIIELQFTNPLIKVMDNNLSTLVNCEKLSLSTNNIDKIAGIGGMKNLKILALGRNNIKFLTGLDFVADTLEQLWISYNLIEKLNGIEKLQQLKIFYASNNKIKDWTEVARLGNLPLLEDVVLKGNPIKREDMDLNVYVSEVKKRVPGLKILDGQGVGGDDEEEDD